MEAACASIALGDIGRKKKGKKKRKEGGEKKKKKPTQPQTIRGKKKNIVAQRAWSHQTLEKRLRRGSVTGV